MIDKENKKIKIEIISAYKLSKQQTEEIAEKYKKIKKANTVDVISKIDTSIIGGVKVIVDGTIYDDSLKTKLTQML
jgi:F-type H+-transporting ATPase subunit delta